MDNQIITFSVISAMIRENQDAKGIHKRDISVRSVIWGGSRKKWWLR
jgi:hypothetical protein